MKNRETHVFPIEISVSFHLLMIFPCPRLSNGSNWNVVLSLSMSLF